MLARIVGMITFICLVLFLGTTAIEGTKIIDEAHALPPASNEVDIQTALDRAYPLTASNEVDIRTAINVRLAVADSLERAGATETAQQIRKQAHDMMWRVPRMAEALRGAGIAPPAGLSEIGTRMDTSERIVEQHDTTVSNMQNQLALESEGRAMMARLIEAHKFDEAKAIGCTLPLMRKTYRYAGEPCPDENLPLVSTGQNEAVLMIKDLMERNEILKVENTQLTEVVDTQESRMDNMAVEMDRLDRQGMIFLILLIVATGGNFFWWKKYRDSIKPYGRVEESGTQ